MPKPRVALAIALSCILALPTTAQDDNPYTAVFKLGAEQAAKQFAGFAYRSACKGKAPKGPESVFCGAVGSFSGESEKEWKENLAKELANIVKGVAMLQEGLNEVRADQQRLLQQNAQVLVRLDEVIGETVAAPAIARVRTLWDEQFAPLSDGRREFTHERVVAFANQVVLQDRVHDQLGQINDTLTRGQIGGKAPLLRLYAQRIAAKLGDVSQADLETPYDFLESVLTELLTEQRKGQFMYMWAASILQAECEVNKKCVQLPHTAVEYETVFASHVEAQITEFNAALEWLVLAGSDTHSRQPGFLHPDATAVFAAADLFSAANLGKGFGLRGRVISMGDAFDGKLNVAERAIGPLRAANVVPSASGRVDWWKATSKPGAYDELRFADTWKVFPYQITDLKPARYGMRTDLPWKPAAVEVGRIDLATGAAAADGATGNDIVPFGSFVALARAGGAHALMSGEWVAEFPDGGRNVTVVGGLEGDLSKPTVDTKIPQVVLQSQGRVIWEALKVGKDQRIEGSVAAQVVRRPQIRYADGGELGLHVELGDTWDALCPQAGCAYAEINHNTVVRLYTDYQKPPRGRSAEVEAHARISLGEGGVAWDERLVTDSKRGAHATQDGPRTARVTLGRGTPASFTLKVDAKLNVPTSGLDSSRFWVLSVLRPTTFYVTP